MQMSQCANSTFCRIQGPHGPSFRLTRRVLHLPHDLSATSLAGPTWDFLHVFTRDECGLGTIFHHRGLWTPLLQIFCCERDKAPEYCSGSHANQGTLLIMKSAGQLNEDVLLVKNTQDSMNNFVDDSGAVSNILDKEVVDGSLSHANLSYKGSSDHIVPDPRIGMVFETEKAAFEYYNQYARMVGFSVRWTTRRLSRKTGLMISRKFVCSKEGHNGDGKVQDLFARYHREGTRCGCPAFMKINIGSDGKYQISGFNTTHNHELATPNYVHMLRSQRNISSTRSAGSRKKKKKKRDAVAEDSASLGITPTMSYQNTAQQADCHADMGLQVDCRNYLQTRRMTALQKFDAAGLLDYFRIRQTQDSSFFYSFQFDVDEQITNSFWADGKMRTDFMHFGDVVCFDTTYKTNDYGRPLALFIGVNHHKQSIIFGAALLYDETADSFRWVFKTLLEAMSGKVPTTILTDESDEITEAVELEFPNTCHRQCVWHLYQNALKNLAHIFTRSKSFDDDFSKCIFDCEVEAELFEGWNAMLVKHSLFENTWLQQKFEEREKWAIVYERTVFCADMKNTQRGECLNKELKICLSPAENIVSFFGSFEKFLEGRRNQELEANFRMTQSQPCVLPVSIIKYAARVYTSSVFYMFMAEYVVGLECLIKEQQDGGLTRIMMVEDGRHHDHIVRVNFREQLLSCSCHKFEFVGILCGHVLSCITNDLRCIPESYVLKRWTRAACSLSNDSSSHTGAFVEGPTHMRSVRYNLLVREFIPLLAMAAEDENAYNCALKLKSTLHEEIKKVTNDKSICVPMTTSDSMYYMTQARNIVNDM